MSELVFISSCLIIQRSKLTDEGRKVGWGSIEEMTGASLLQLQSDFSYERKDETVEIR